MTQWIARGFWVLADQALLSVSSLTVAILIAHASTTEDFGAYGVAFTTYALLLSLMRAAVVMPFMMSANQDSSLRYSTRSTLTLGILGATLLSFAGIVAGLGIGGALREWLLVLAVVLPFLIGQDVLRYCVLDRRGVVQLFATDIAWFCSHSVAQAIIWCTIESQPRIILLAWGLTSLASFPIALSLLPREARTSTREQLTRSWRTGLDLVLEALAASGSQGIAVLSIVGFSGLNVGAGIRGAQVVMGPVATVMQAFATALTPTAIRLSESPERLRGWTRKSALGLMAAPLAFAVLTLAIPDTTGRALIGVSWVHAANLIFPLAVGLSVGGATSAVLIEFRASNVTRETMLIRWATFPLPIVLGVLGVSLGGAVGALYGMAFASALLLSLLLILRSRIHVSRS